MAKSPFFAAMRAKSDRLLDRPTLNLELGQRTKHGGLDGCELLTGEITFTKLAFGTGDGLHGGILIDFLFFERHVGQDRNSIGTDFKEARAYGEIEITFLGRDSECPGMNFGQKGNMLGKNSKLPLDSWNDHKLHLS